MFLRRFIQEGNGREVDEESVSSMILFNHGAGLRG